MRTKDILQCARFQKANCCLMIHNAHFSKHCQVHFSMSPNLIIFLSEFKTVHVAVAFHVSIRRNNREGNRIYLSFLNLST